MSWRRISSSSSEDVFKTSWLRRIYSSHLQKTSWRRFQDILVKTNIFVLVIHLQEVSRTSSRYLQDCLRDAFSVTIYRLTRRLVRYLQDGFVKTKHCYAEDVLKTSSRHALKKSSRCLEDQQLLAGQFRSAVVF